MTGVPTSSASIGPVPSSGRLPAAYTTPGSSSFAQFLAQAAPELLPGNRPTGGGDLGVPHGTTIVAVTFDGGIVMAGDRQALQGDDVRQRLAL